MSKPTRTINLSLTSTPREVAVSEVLTEQHTILLHGVDKYGPAAGIFFPVTIADGVTICGLADLTDTEIRQALLDSAMDQAATLTDDPTRLALITEARTLDADEFDSAAGSVATALSEGASDRLDEAIAPYRFHAE